MLIAPKPHRGWTAPGSRTRRPGAASRFGSRQPDATLEQLKQGGFKCSLKTLWYALDRLGLTAEEHATQRDRPDVQAKREQFRQKIT